MPSILFPQREFAKRGWQVYFLCPVKEDAPRYSFTEGIHIHSFGFPFNFRKVAYFQTDTLSRRLKATVLHNLNWFFFQVFGLLSAIKTAVKLKPGIIYAHSPASAFVAFLISIFFRAKLVVRLYGVRQLYFKRKSFLLRIKELRDYFVFKIPASYFIITNDGTYGNLLAKSLGVPDCRIKYWRNGIDQSFYEPEPDAKKDICRHLNINPSMKIIVSTSRLNYEYGVDRLLISLVQLFKKDNNCVCLIIGSGPEQRRLTTFVQENNISSRVFFPGIIGRGMLKKMLYAADIFIFLPRYHNCTNTVWEAMASARCILASENPAIKEVLTSGKDAILVPEEALEGVPNILERLLNDDNLRENLGSNARQRAREVLVSWPERIKKEIKLLESLAGKK